jgi:error-prone DNA polymerase
LVSSAAAATRLRADGAYRHLASGGGRFQLILLDEALARCAESLLQRRVFAELHHRLRESGRARPGRRVTENLIMAGALDGFGIPRRHLLWELGTLRDRPDALKLVYKPEEVELPAQTSVEALLSEQAVQGLSAGEHIMTHVRPRLAPDVLSTTQLVACRNGQRVRVAGLLVVHQSPPTAKGFHFLTLEDEEGLVDVIVRPQIYERHRSVLHASRLLLVEGVVQQEGNVTNVLAGRITPLQA